MEIASLLTQGVDLWLNTPMRPREASGTSGMKCTMNGIMNFSVLDGWWIEGWIEDVTGWSIGPEPSASDFDRYDESLDAADLYDKLEKKIIPTYYDNHHKRVSMMQHTNALNASFFNTHRVVREYASKAYSIDFRGM
jgi:starch phosphorylase